LVARTAGGREVASSNLVIPTSFTLTLTKFIMKIIDISLPIEPGMPIYPGTDKTKFEPKLSSSGSSILTLISMSSHAGTHIDAPIHSIKEAASIDKYKLDMFYGDCRVIDLSHVESEITRGDLEPAKIQPYEKILLKTQNSIRGFDKFYDSWVGLSADAAEHLSGLKVSLVGIDWLGIKPKGALDNATHLALLSKAIPILEGLDLSLADEGTYTLSAFPIKYQGIDGAQVRAVLITP
jgi:arylformamidase